MWCRHTRECFSAVQRESAAAYTGLEVTILSATHEAGKDTHSMISFTSRTGNLCAYSGRREKGGDQRAGGWGRG